MSKDTKGAWIQLFIPADLHTKAVKFKADENIAGNKKASIRDFCVTMIRAGVEVKGL